MCEVCLNGTYPNCPVCGDEPEYKEAEAQTTLEIHVNCPYCDNFMDVTELLIEELNCGPLTAKSLDIIVKCDNKSCKESFIINNVNY
jgi:hypothetical protein